VSKGWGSGGISSDAPLSISLCLSDSEGGGRVAAPSRPPRPSLLGGILTSYSAEWGDASRRRYELATLSAEAGGQAAAAATSGDNLL